MIDAPLIVAAALAGLASGGNSLAPAEAQSSSIRTNAATIFQLAYAAEARGDRPTAEKAYRALAMDSSPLVRAEARFRLAKLVAAAGRTSEAAALLRQIIDEQPTATSARLELAATMATLGDEDGALRQLRAVRSGPLPPDVVRMVDRFHDALRARRPFGGSFEIGFAPDSNINRATRSDTLGTVLGDFDIGEDGKAKSGTGLEMRGQLYRRFDLFEVASLQVRLSGSGDFYKRKEFNQAAVDLTIGPELQFGRTKLTLDAGATQRWFGAKVFSRQLHLGGSAAFPLGSRTFARASAGISTVDNRLNGLQAGRELSLQLGAERALGTQSGIVVTASGSRFAARDPGYSTRSWRAGLQGWRDFGRTTFVAGFQYGQLGADERLILLPEKREDRYRSLSLGVVMRGLSVGQFAPSIRLTRERNVSNIEFYDYRRTRTEFAIVRSF
jgi:tetratricopeptide (TPR) repeat protein